MSDETRHPLEPVLPDPLTGVDVVDEGDGYWMSPGAARKFRRRARAVAVIIIFLGVSGVLGWTALDTANTARDENHQETLDRIAANTEIIRKNCVALNKVAEAAKAVTFGSRAALTQEDVEKVSDPQIRALLQAIVTRSTGNQTRIRELGEAIPIQDCDAQAKRTDDAGGG